MANGIGIGPDIGTCTGPFTGLCTRALQPGPAPGPCTRPCTWPCTWPSSRERTSGSWCESLLEAISQYVEILQPDDSVDKLAAWLEQQQGDLLGTVFFL